MCHCQLSLHIPCINTHLSPATHCSVVRCLRFADVLFFIDILLTSRACVKIAVATLSDNSLRQTVHTHRASVHQAAKLAAVLLRVAGVTVGLAENNGSLAYRRVYDSRHLQADCQEPGSAPERYARQSSAGMGDFCRTNNYYLNI